MQLYVHCLPVLSWSSDVGSQFLEGLVERQPDISLEELHNALAETINVHVSMQTVSRMLRRRGFSRKQASLVQWNPHAAVDVQVCQVTRPALEHDEYDRAAYRLLIGEHFEPWQLVFAGESHFNRLTL